MPEILTRQLQIYVQGFWETLPLLLVAFVVLGLTWAVSRFGALLTGRVLARLRLRRSLIEVLQMLFSIGVWIFGIMIALTVVFPSMTPGRIVTAIGLGSIAVGLAFKDIFENFIAGMLILFREPFRLGDYIECEEIDGRVEEITIRDTHVRQTDGQRIVMPNAMLFKSPVTVRTDRDIRRTTIICGVAYGEDVDEARDVIERAVKAVESVRDDQPVQIFAQGFGSSSIDFEVTWWTGSKPVDIRRSRDQVVAAVKRALDQAGIEIPFPYRTLTFKHPLPISRSRPDDS
jgi:small-conductance mechanosensitive channel